MQVIQYFRYEKDMITWDSPSFFIGLLLGMIIMLIFIWIAYNTRSFVFTYCATGTRGCVGAQYYNDPGVALAHNPQLTASDILFIRDDELWYTRVPRVTNCIPESNQTIQIVQPQYCAFSGTGATNVTYRQIAPGSNIYNPYGTVGPTITTTANCDPSDGQTLTSGIPLIKWDPVLSE